MVYQIGQKPKYPQDITGMRFGKLVVIKKVTPTIKGHTRWEERRTKILKTIEERKADIAILTQAKKHYKDLNQI